jgi:hypothetical protein
MRTLIVGVVVLVGLGIAAGPGRASQETSLADILERAGKYVRQFERDFAMVISDEHHGQDQYPRTMDDLPGRNYGSPRTMGLSVRSNVHRETRSEMLFVRGERELAWLAVRNVLMVKDGIGTGSLWQSIPESKDRLDRALRDTSPGQPLRLRTLADDGARFNLGRRIYRNFNTPPLALQLLGLEFQPRFAFTLAGREKVAGSPTVKLAFAERGSPTVIAFKDQDLPSAGEVWVREADGAILRTHVTLRAPQTDEGPSMDVSIRVDYRHDAKLDMWVPAQMTERYTERRQPGERIYCYATYSNYRRFETSGRLVIP